MTLSGRRVLATGAKWLAEKGRGAQRRALPNMSAWRIPMLVPTLEGRTSEYLLECVETNFVSSIGPFVARFEDGLASLLGAPDALACASGTAALHLALVATGVGPGDEVMVSDLTFIASANAALYCGASVTLVDSEPATWNLDPELVIGELERRHRGNLPQPSAIVAVHLLGHPPDLANLLEAARAHGVPVIEDAAEALGAAWVQGPLDGVAAGAAGSLGCFSFNGNKLLTTGGGGALVAADRAVLDRARHLSTQARLSGIGSEHDEIGFNYRMSNLAAAVGLAQLERIETFLMKKRGIAARYDEALAGLDRVSLPPSAPWARRSAWLYTVLLDGRETRDRVLAALYNNGIESRPLWPPLHRQVPYKDAVRIGGAVADNLSDRALSLPSSVTLSPAEQDEVITVVRNAVSSR